MNDFELLAASEKLYRDKLRIERTKVEKFEQILQDYQHLFKFYGVDTINELLEVMEGHIERLQKKLPSLKDEQPGRSPRGG